MSDSRDRHQPIDSYCQLCGDSATWKFTSVSGLNRHCVMMHAHIFTRSGGYRPIPAEHIRIYQDKVRAGRGPTRKARGSLSNSDRHPSWTDYPRLSASVGSPSVADVAQVSVVQVSQPYLPPPPPTLPSPDLVTSRPAAQHADAGGARERYVVVAEDITPDSTSTYNLQPEELLTGPDLEAAASDPFSQYVGFDRAPSSSSLRTPSLTGLLSARASPQPPPILTIDDIVTAALRPGPFSAADIADALERRFSGPPGADTLEYLLTLARATRMAVAREYAATFTRAVLAGGSDAEILATVRRFIDALNCDN